ncbi:hypothetical protein QR680_004738 [Steinernema hermaphroditum]|uniref:Uncharacterized protein n=1 Tax=Steinernema hermaphroditum TaxID=289476 RepID=A0AA39LU63_9BILA|nr:hypothetical protein QR680_004738 [Steinernema hermaphroditum]
MAYKLLNESAPNRICTPLAWMVFYLDVSYFSADTSRPYPLTAHIKMTTNNLTLVSLILTGGLYLLTIAVLIYRRKQFTGSQTIISKAEFLILVQAFVIFLSCLWNRFGTMNSDKMFDPQSIGFAIWYYVMQFSLQWINPILYLLMNT